MNCVRMEMPLTIKKESMKHGSKTWSNNLTKFETAIISSNTQKYNYYLLRERYRVTAATNDQRS